MDTATQTQNEETQDHFDGTEHHTFSPSISKRRIVDSEIYYVRRFFMGRKDFEKTMQQLAARQAHNKKTR